MKTNAKYAITRDKFLSSDEARRLMKVTTEKGELDVLKGRQTWPTRAMLVHLALYSGLRVAEIAALRVGDIRLNGKENYLIVQRGKGDKKRDVYLDSDLARALRGYLGLKRAWGEEISDQSPFFAGRGGKTYTTTALALSFKQALQAARLPVSYSIHSARHTYATLLLAKTNNLRYVQKQLGHASLNMTALYADVLPEMNQNLANAILD